MNSLIFNSKKEVIDFLKTTSGLKPNLTETSFSPAGTYYLSHGEYSQPDYTPRHYKQGWSIHVEYFFYAGTFNTKAGGRIEPDLFFERFHAEYC